jgi:hypothetical protein
MASTQSKASAAGKSAGRSVSSSRLVAQKPPKPQKLAAAIKPRSTPPAASDSAALRKTGRFPKGRTSSIPPASEERAPVASVRPGPEDTTRSGHSKSELKAQFAKLSAATAQIAGFKRSLGKTFFDIGVLLNQVRDERLYEVKGYGSFESFVEREVDINKALCLKIARVAEAIHREFALAAGLERSVAAAAALDGESEPAGVFRPAGSPGGIPAHKL